MFYTIPWVNCPCLILQHHAGHICMVHPSPTLNDVTCQGYTNAHWSKLCVSFRYKRTYQTCHIPPSCLLESPCTLHHPSAHRLIPPIKLPTHLLDQFHQVQGKHVFLNLESKSHMFYVRHLGQFPADLLESRQ